MERHEIHHDIDDSHREGDGDISTPSSPSLTFERGVPVIPSQDPSSLPCLEPCFFPADGSDTDESFSGEGPSSPASLPDLIPSPDTSMDTADEDISGDDDTTPPPQMSPPNGLVPGNADANDAKALQARRIEAMFQSASKRTQLTLCLAKYNVACTQQTHLSRRIGDTRVRLRRALANDNQRFAHFLRQRMTTLSGVRAMFIEYADRTLDSVESLRNEICALERDINSINNQLEVHNYPLPCFFESVAPSIHV